MVNPLRSRFRRRLTAATLVLAVLLVGALDLNLQASRTGADDNAESGNRAVSARVWATQQEVMERYPLARHQELMRQAIANSRKAGVEKRTGGAFGAVIANREGNVVGEGSNQVVAHCDPTWHGEMEAIRGACKRLGRLKLDGCVLYTSSEPCPMCLATAYWAGLDSIIYAADVEDAKTYGNFDDKFIYEQFARPIDARAIPQVQLLRDEAVVVWKEYAKQPDNIPY